MNFCAVAVGAGLVLPLPGVERAFDEDLRAFGQVCLSEGAERLGKDDDTVPLGAFAAFATGLVDPAFAGSDAESDDAAATWRGADFRRTAKMADEHGTIERT